MITANMYFNRLNGWEGWRQNTILPELARHLIPEQGYVDSKPLIAYVNNGNWLVKCPDCNGIEGAWEEGNFMCMNCFNSSVGHKYRKTVFPDNRREIEILLFPRPLVNRNWAGETLDKLKEENEVHKSELLEVL
jgi:hypothetical protein